jgi:hypothetical protein
MDIQDNIKNGVFSHTKITKLLKDYVLSNHRPPGIIEKLTKANNCDFGTWLDGPETIPFHQKTQFEELKQIHKIYHDEIKRITACIQKNEMNLARVLMKEGENQKTLAQFIDALFNFLDQVKRDENYKNSKKK